MSGFDFDEIEEELDLVVPEIYRLFIEIVDAKGYDLSEWLIYHNTETLIKHNWHNRLHCEHPKWKDHYLDFGVGDGCGNTFFLIANSEDDDIVQLWSHDPPGIEEVSTGTDFFKGLIAALENRFAGAEKYVYTGNAWLSD